MDLHAHGGAAVHVRPALGQGLGLVGLVWAHEIEAAHHFLLGQARLHRGVAVEAHGEEGQVVDDEAAADAVDLDGVVLVGQARDHGRGTGDLGAAGHEAAGDVAVALGQAGEGHGHGDAPPHVRVHAGYQDLVAPQHLGHGAGEGEGVGVGQQDEVAGALVGVVALAGHHLQ